MYIFDFFKKIFNKNKIGVIIWVLLNIVMIVAIFSSGFRSLVGGILGFVLYILSLYITFSPIGEWMLRLQTGCKRITEPEDIDRLEPLFEEVYAKAKEKTPELNDGIKLFINSSDVPIAFAVGRKTVCVTKGLLECSDDHIKAVLAHEFGHFAHKDTDSFLLVTTGNFIISTILIILRLLCGLIVGILSFVLCILLPFDFTKNIILFFKTILYAVFRLVMFLWSKLGMFFCRAFDREKEYTADIYACECGYGAMLADVLENADSLGIDSLVFSNCDVSKRIEKIISCIE